jgi:hypothetical protein
LRGVTAGGGGEKPFDISAIIQGGGGYPMKGAGYSMINV